MSFFVFLCAFLSAVAAQRVNPGGFNAPPPTLTGDAKRDFSALPGTVRVDDNSGLFVGADVGLPPGWPYPYSGWDVESVFLRYDTQTDVLYLAIDCFAVCGDADGDGDPNVSAPQLVARGGTDLANMQGSEAFVIAIDVDLDTRFDVVVGYPGQAPEGSKRRPCGDADGVTCFGVYLYAGVSRADPYEKALYDTASGVLPHPATDHNVATSIAKPDLEWSIENFDVLRQKLGAQPIDKKGVEPWALHFRLFAGSFQDDGIGEDFLPNDAEFVRIDFPCFAYDACDVCGGDGSSCVDCAGVPNGPNDYDVCDVCAGDGRSCLDCAGVPNGPAVYDSCDICNGSDNTCSDCAGVIGGSDTYDVCGVCGGDGLSCFERELCSESFDRCALDAGSVWRGTFNRTARLAPVSSMPFQLTVGADAYAAVSAEGTRGGTNKLFASFLRMALIDTGLLGLQTVDADVAVTKAEQNAFLRFGCDARPAKYTARFTNDCSVLHLVPLEDQCQTRRELLNSVLLRKDPCVELPRAAPYTRTSATPPPKQPWAKASPLQQNAAGEYILRFPKSVANETCGVDAGHVYAVHYNNLANMADRVNGAHAHEAHSDDTNGWGRPLPTQKPTKQGDLDDDDEDGDGETENSKVQAAQYYVSATPEELAAARQVGLLVVGPHGVFMETSIHGMFMGVMAGYAPESNPEMAQVAFDACELAAQRRADVHGQCKREDHFLPQLTFTHSCRAATVKLLADACMSRFDRLQHAQLERIDCCGNAEALVDEGEDDDDSTSISSSVMRHHDTSAERKHREGAFDDDDDSSSFSHVYSFSSLLSSSSMSSSVLRESSTTDRLLREKYPYVVTKEEQKDRQKLFRGNAHHAKPSSDDPFYPSSSVERSSMSSSYVPHHTLTSPDLLRHRLKFHAPPGKYEVQDRKNFHNPDKSWEGQNARFYRPQHDDDDDVFTSSC